MCPHVWYVHLSTCLQKDKQLNVAQHSFREYLSVLCANLKLFHNLEYIKIRGDQHVPVHSPSASIGLPSPPNTPPTQCRSRPSSDNCLDNLLWQDDQTKMCVGDSYLTLNTVWYLITSKRKEQDIGNQKPLKEKAMSLSWNPHPNSRTLLVPI